MYHPIVAIILQALDIQIFNADDIVIVDVHPGKRVKEIRSLAIDFPRSLIQLIPKFLAIIGAFLSPGKPSLDTHVP